MDDGGSNGEWSCEIARLAFVVTSVVSTRAHQNNDGVRGTLATVVGVYGFDRGGRSVGAVVRQGWSLQLP